MRRGVRRVVAAALGEPAVFDIVERAQLPHQSNRLFDVWHDGRHLIAKAFMQRDRPDAAATEYRSLHIVEPLQIAPRPVFFNPDVGNVVLYEFLDGTMWDRHIPSAAALRQLADIWIHQHALPTDGLWLARGQRLSWPEIDARLRSGFHSYAAWAQGQDDPRKKALADRCLRAVDTCSRVAGVLAGMPTPLRFCRSDARFANVIARPDGSLGLVDWEDSGLRDPARELADLLTHPNQEDLLSPDTWSAFLDPYCAAARRGDATLSARLDLYLPAFAAHWLGLLLAEGVERARHGSLETWRINDMPANARLRRYLARAETAQTSDVSALLADLEETVFFDIP